MKRINLKKGSVTVEASIVLPIFISLIICIAFFIKLVYIQEIMQHAIDQTASEMASQAYIYRVSGLQQVNDKVRDGLKSNSDTFKKHLSTVMDTFSSLNSLTEKGGNTAEDKSYVDKLGEVKNNFDNLINSSNEIIQNPIDELKSIAFLIAGGAFDDMKTELFIPITRLYMKKYLTSDRLKNADQRLKGLNIINGYRGLDFSSSHFFQDSNNDIDIIVSYSVDIPVPFNIIPDLGIIQRATARAWLGGDADSIGLKSDTTDIWSLSNFERGTKLREIFGGNLPTTFPVIASFNKALGEAEMIKSMDLTTEFYQSKGSNITDKIKGYIKELVDFNGAKHGDTEIRGDQIVSKQLTLIIPKNTLKPEVKQALDQTVSDAAASGVYLKIEEYGEKQVDPRSTEK
jgi:hypothetical protein